MKTTILVPFTVLAAAATAFAQGPLTPPPGAPAPLMKSLDQVEARTPLVAGQPGVSVNVNGTITISQPGSYYLTGNLTLTAVGANGININTSQVTLDLNGFTLTHVTGNGGDAIAISAGNVTVRNGSIRGGTTVTGSTFTHAGWDEGVTAGIYPNLIAEDLKVFGVRTNGINLFYEGSRIERCTVHTAGGLGLYATSISSCTARKTGATAISVSSDPDSGSVTDCFAETVSPTGHAIYAPDGMVSNSRGISVGGFGIWAETASNCYGSSGSDTGLVATVANNCRGVSTSGVGIGATTVTGSYAQSTSGTFAISATLVTGCVAKRDGGVAISANTVNGCHLMSGTLVTTNKYNMP